MILMNLTEKLQVQAGSVKLRKIDAKNSNFETCVYQGQVQMFISGHHQD